MLPEINLDDESFADICKQATEKIAEFYPKWTDYNFHDPGITMIELFAWLKEMQQFHMNQITEEHIRRYLHLMGIVPRGRQPSTAVIRFQNLDEELPIAAGTRFYADNICFETISPTVVSPANIVRLIRCSHTHNETTPDAAKETTREIAMVHETADSLQLPIFGTHPKAGDYLLIGLDRPLSPHRLHRLSIHLADLKKGTRSKFAEKQPFYPLAALSLSYFTGQGELEIQNVQDTTHQLLVDGFLSFRLEHRMTDAPAAGEAKSTSLYWLKLTLKRNEYDLPPVLSDISLRETEVVQRQTLAEYHDGHIHENEPITLSTRLALTGKYLLFRRENNCFFPCDLHMKRTLFNTFAQFEFENAPTAFSLDYRLICYAGEYADHMLVGIGTGLPFQEYQLKLPNLCGDSLCLMVETETGSGCYTEAAYCTDFADKGPQELVFRFDETTQTLHFGDCDHGEAPEGKILLAAAHQSLGVYGNVGMERIRSFDTSSPLPGHPQISNAQPSHGGSNTMTIQDCQRELQKQQQSVSRAVTYEDFEKLVMQTPGLMIDSVKAIPVTALRKQDGSMDEECISLVVKPCSLEPKASLNNAFKKNILAALEGRRPIGTKIVLLSPEYAGVSIFAELTSDTNEMAARKQIEAALADYFESIRGQFGAAVRISTIYGILDILACVAAIHSLSLDAQGNHIRRSRGGDLILPANGLAYLEECILSISSDK